METRRHQETGLRVLAGILILASVLLLLLALQQVSRQQGVSIQGLALAIAWSLGPAVSGWLIWKLATALEWLADIKRKLDA